MDIDAATQRYFAEWKEKELQRTDETLRVGGAPVMFTWEEPLMAEFAKRLDVNGQDVLEIGFGMGVAATCMQQYGPRSHTILEPHPAIYQMAMNWREKFATEITIINDYWQNKILELPKVDVVFYDSSNADGNVHKDKFAFFELAAKQLLRAGGRLGFWYKGDALPGDYQRELMKWFDSVHLTWVGDLEPTYEAQVLGFGQTMIVPIAKLD